MAEFYPDTCWKNLRNSIGNPLPSVFRKLDGNDKRVSTGTKFVVVDVDSDARLVCSLNYASYTRGKRAGAAPWVPNGDGGRGIATVPTVVQRRLLLQVSILFEFRRCESHIIYCNVIYPQLTYPNAANFRTALNYTLSFNCGHK